MKTIKIGQYFFTIGIVLMPAAVCAQEEQGFSFSLGLGTAYTAKYPGDDEYHAVPVPLVDISYNFGNSVGTSLSFDGDLKLTAVETDQFSFGLGVGYGGGRDSDVAKIFKGLPDIDDSAAVKLFGSFTVYEAISFDLSVEKYTGGTEGLQATLGANAGIPLSDRAILQAGLSTTYSDDDYASGIFGVSASQAAKSTQGLKEYSASGGFSSVDLNIALGYQITESTTGIASIGATKLIGDAADSPFTKDDVNPVIILGVIYEF